MNIPETQTPRYEQTKQFINFVEGTDNEEPDEEQFPVHVLTGDTFLYHINGGDAPGESDPFVTDILVYPSAEYWVTLLNGDRQRPYFDLSISEYNTLRIPSAISDYDLYVDSAQFYENATVDGILSVTGTSAFTDDVAMGSDLTVTGDVTAANFNGFAKTKTPTASKTGDYTISSDDTGYVILSSPAASNTNIALPASGIATGTTVTVIHCLVGKTTTFTGTLLARGPVLSEQYSAATVFYDGSDWYGLGDLV